MKVPIVGGAITTLASGQTDPFGITVGAATVYWTTYVNDVVMKVSTGGGTPASVGAGPNGASGQANVIAVDGTSVYWSGNGTSLKAPIGGGVVTTLTNSGQVNGIVVDATSIYLTFDPYGTCDGGACGGLVMKITPK
jgi:hypothetical protein